MPAVTVEVRFPYSKEDETRIIDAVHSSMMFALKTPDWDKTIRLIVHEPHRFTGPPTKGEKYTLISFDMFSGRSLESKRALYAAIVDNLENVGIPRDEVMIVLREHPQENWGIQGGKAASDVNIGFKINV